MQSPDWLERLTPHAVRMTDLPLHRLIVAEPGRAAATGLQVGPILASFARQRIDAASWDALLEVAGERELDAAIAALFDGVSVNQSEHRPALHTALRSDLGSTPTARAAHAQARAARAAMREQIEALAAAGVTDLVNIGIGGSDLGPRLALEALRDFDPGRFRVHFLGSSDGHAATHLLRRLDPDRSAAVLVSKSFGTRESLLNGGHVRQWLGGTERLLAVTAAPERALAWGIAPQRVLPMGEWVGGRYSLWSSVGFVVAAALGMDVFERLLAGAALMDRHVREAPAAHNLAIRHGLTAVWNRNAMGCDSHAILPYDTRLARLPAYLQQLVMESLGKGVLQDGSAVACGTSPVIWGASGNDAQHSFYQALHQGTDTVPMDFIGVIRPDHAWPEAHRELTANLLAQAEAFANGAPSDDPRKRHPGNRPSTMILLDQLTPESLGALIALYEHSVYVQATIWGINPFDQWGVELGKKLANALLPALSDAQATVEDPVTAALLAEIRRVSA